MIGELRSGIERIRKKDSQAAFHLDNWLQEVVDNYKVRIFPVTQEIAEAWRVMNVRDPVSTL